MKSTRRRFTPEFKAEIVRLVLDGVQSVPAVSRDHDLGESCVYLCAKQARVNRGDGPDGALTTDEKAELTRLRREVRELKRERDFVEQATAYFAKGKRWNSRSSPRRQVTSRSPCCVVASRFHRPAFTACWGLASRGAPGRTANSAC